ncbi:hypothetical protein L207DRAFT_522425 [Hyaloscypha variabilis F]|uniref:Uncharacterized protein n=1 Tax=Hyaloscypha variabilis (strain UAMH 11265 / GT02V1 / F) TaxID=1149755 RepID=A0A2J6S867_HYAVF|nr:hypothetical protein L207DRAFT_522425 [Hyaloscypha variabilis F]
MVVTNSQYGPPNGYQNAPQNGYPAPQQNDFQNPPQNDHTNTQNTNTQQPPPNRSNRPTISHQQFTIQGNIAHGYLVPHEEEAKVHTNNTWAKFDGYYNNNSSNNEDLGALVIAAETRSGGAKRRRTKEDSEARHTVEPKTRKRVNFEDMEIKGEPISGRISHKQSIPSQPAFAGFGNSDSTSTSAKPEKKKRATRNSKELKEIFIRKGLGQLDYLVLIDNFTVTITLKELAQMSPDWSRWLRKATTRMNNKKKKPKESSNYEPPSIKEEVLAVTVPLYDVRAIIDITQFTIRISDPSLGETYQNIQSPKFIKSSKHGLILIPTLRDNPFDQLSTISCEPVSDSSSHIRATPTKQTTKQDYTDDETDTNSSTSEEFEESNNSNNSNTSNNYEPANEREKRELPHNIKVSNKPDSEGPREVLKSSTIDSTHRALIPRKVNTLEAAFGASSKVREPSRDGSKLLASGIGGSGQSESRISATSRAPETDIEKTMIIATYKDENTSIKSSATTYSFEIELEDPLNLVPFEGEQPACITNAYTTHSCFEFTIFVAG